MTQLLTKEKVDVEPTPIRAGVWRNKFTCERNFKMLNGATYSAGSHISEAAWPSREIAEERWFNALRRDPEIIELVGLRYLGPVFFPEANPDP